MRPQMRYAHSSVRPIERRSASIQVLIDLVRESTKVNRPVSVGQVTDFSFLERAQKELGLK
jgi:hypothetical protein